MLTLRSSLQSCTMARMHVEHRERTISAFVLLFASCYVSTGQGKTITCLCSTEDCQSQGSPTCTTNTMCYIQHFDRHDGRDPVVRGCTDSRTPLLCENKRPAVPGYKWPLLYCCNHSMCNEKEDSLLSSQPNATERPFKTAAINNSHNNNNTYNHQSQTPEDLSVHPVSHWPRTTSGTSTTSADGGNRRSPLISPMYVAVLVIGVALLVIIGGLAMCVLRRHTRRLYGRQFSIDRGGYLKGQCTCLHEPHPLMPTKQCHGFQTAPNGTIVANGAASPSSVVTVTT